MQIKPLSLSLAPHCAVLIRHILDRLGTAVAWANFIKLTLHSCTVKSLAKLYCKVGNSSVLCGVLLTLNAAYNNYAFVYGTETFCPSMFCNSSALFCTM